jgi:acylphosphatase
MQKHYNITITGKVQGVFFRASARTEAERLNISGFARNEPNSDVYIEAEGKSDDLTHFLEWCGHGPSRAKVERILVEEGEMVLYSGFEVRRN